jgi:hypothetical protein
VLRLLQKKLGEDYRIHNRRCHRFAMPTPPPTP